MVTPDDVLEYWFGPGGGDAADTAPRIDFWFKGGKEVDQAIDARFGEDVRAAIRGERAHWASTPRGALALVVLIDQFARNIHRDSPNAFAGDPLTQTLVQAMVASGEDERLSIFQRSFLYLPLEHAEDLDLQDLAVACFARLVDQSAPAQVDLCRYFHQFAERHREPIARFGRFPHRNPVLGRVTTAEEHAWLDAHGGFV